MFEKKYFSLTPSQIEGPFYPTTYRTDEDNNLNVITHTKKPQGQIIRLQGKVRASTGEPMPNILIETWQADHNGCYNHPRDKQPLDPNFKYWGKMVTDLEGNYHFNSVIPGAYNDEGDWRTPHIHFKVYRTRGAIALTTQIYFSGQSLNAQDKHLNGLSMEEQALLIVYPHQDPNYPDILLCDFNITLPF